MASGKYAKLVHVLANSTLHILVGVVVGMAVGVSISRGKIGKDVVTWLGMPGALFIRGLKCLVVPLIFGQIFLATVHLLSVGMTMAIGRNTILMYLLTTVLACIQGLLWAEVFRPFMALPQSDNRDELRARFFDAKIDSVTFSETLKTGVFYKLVPVNFVGSFVAPNFLGVIVLGISLAVAYSRTKQAHDAFLPFVKQSTDMFVILLGWWIMLTPVAVCSLIIGAVGAQEDIFGGLKNLGFLVASAICAWFTHVSMVYMSLYVFFVRSNPFTYLKKILPALAVAVSTASSAATLPVTQRCVAASKVVPSSIRDFVLSIGATVNMDGSAIYIPAVLSFLVMNNQLQDQLGPASYALIALLSTLGSAGAAPVPSATLVVTLTAYSTIFTVGGDTPLGFEFVWAIDWFMDRMRTTVNVLGDAMMARIITAMEEGLVGEDVEKGNQSVDRSTIETCDVAESA